MSELLTRMTRADQPLPYCIHVPPGYTNTRAWPVILFLHGAGERGDDGLRQTRVGLGPALQRDPDRFPALVVMPQAPANETWTGAAADGAMTALRETVAEFACDEDRVYLTGISMGGNGAWHLMSNHGSRFAALVPICGWVSRTRGAGGVPAGRDAHLLELAKHVARTPTWIFHGADDTVVRVEESRRAAAVLERAGCDVRYTELPGVRHNSWDPAYAMPELTSWLFAQQRRR